MAQIQSGAGGALLQVEPNTLAARVTLRDIDYGVLGIYSVGGTNGATQMTAGMAANAPVFSLRWTHATNLLSLRRLTLSMGAGATAFTAGAALINLFAARSYSATDTGGTSILPSGNQNKLRASMGTTLLTDIRISNTVPLGAGTRTLDTNPLASIAAGVPAVAGQPIVSPPFALFDARPGEHPLTLVQNEGVVLQISVPATGTWFFGIKSEWAELAAY